MPASILAAEQSWTLFWGDASSKQQAQSTPASGTVVYAGTVAESQQSQSVSSSGLLTFSAATSTAQSRQVSSASGKLEFVGTVTTAQAAQSTSASAGDVFTGAASSAQAPQSVSATGAVTPAATQPNTNGGGTWFRPFRWIPIPEDAPEAYGSCRLRQAKQVTVASGVVTPPRNRINRPVIINAPVIIAMTGPRKENIIIEFEGCDDLTEEEKEMLELLALTS